ncbi:MAG: type II toxin-antitoxin system HicB family antitoxin [Methanocalculus sp. MSAO_Arc2]|uniref:type II toxin-antitoxin system HicB family antitoxin n=1 Tax=Methanocalculus sp. MSAO_Arc2 TaxID=2293855 RepID=UPI000FF0E1A8|nr:MAG: type II toxin-antitoxin system HicB family antitoxin [Methanocalculus sp. MSAO_Arc2]
MISIEKDDDGYYAHIPAVQGCYAQDDTYLEALGNLKEVLQLILEEEGTDRGIGSKETKHDFTM